MGWYNANLFTRLSDLTYIAKLIHSKMIFIVPVPPISLKNFLKTNKQKVKLKDKTTRWKCVGKQDIQKVSLYSCQRQLTNHKEKKVLLWWRDLAVTMLTKGSNLADHTSPIICIFLPKCLTWMWSWGSHRLIQIMDHSTRQLAWNLRSWRTEKGKHSC